MLPEEINKILPDAVGKKFTAKGDSKTGEVPGLAFSKGKFGFVDFRTLTVERAEDLVSKGFPYLAKKEREAPATKA